MMTSLNTKHMTVLGNNMHTINHYNIELNKKSKKKGTIKKIF